MIDFDVAYDKLAGLESAYDIADLFKDYGVKAVKGRSDMCAISVWIADQTGLEIMTNLSAVFVLNIEDGYANIVQRRENTNAMSKFVCEFDLGLHPDLERAI